VFWYYTHITSVLLSIYLYIRLNNITPNTCHIYVIVEQHNEYHSIVNSNPHVYSTWYGEYVAAAKWLTVVSPDGPYDIELLLAPTVFPPAKVYQEALFEARMPLTAFAVETCCIGSTEGQEGCRFSTRDGLKLSVVLRSDRPPAGTQSEVSCRLPRGRIARFVLPNQGARSEGICQ